MHVDVDYRKLRPRRQMLGRLQLRLRPELVEREISAIAAIKRFIWVWLGATGG
ncbi:MAG TPA: hypothetical protein VN699_14945 [Pirellulales bacterium]|nr:hypothetical protein [Pirellulales bacterium]